jgi:hypothetical protein
MNAYAATPTMKQVRPFAAACLITFAAALAAGGPGAVTVTGVVEDETGGAVPSAIVTLVNKTNGQRHETRTDDVGGFAFENVPPGVYSLSGRADELESGPTDLTVADRPVRARLRVRITVEEQLTVRAPADPAAPERNGGTVTLGEGMLNGLPLDGRDIASVLANFVAPAAGGTEGLSFIVDGLETDEIDDLPACEIKRVVIDRNPYGAEYRRPGGARVEVITDRGSARRFHGSAAFFGHDSVFDARNALARVRPDSRRMLFQGTLSGPLGLKHSSFFVAYQRLRNNEAAIVNARTLSGPLILNVPRALVRTDAVGRVNLHVGSGHTVTAAYGFDDKLESNRGVGGFHLLDRGIRATRWGHDARLTYQAVLSSSFLNTLRVRLGRNAAREGTRAEAPAITVNGAFASGPSPISTDRRETLLELQDSATYTRHNHTFGFGVETRARRVDAVDASNFAGTFEFSSLRQFGLGAPYLFRIDQGQPNVTFTIRESEAYLQDKVTFGRSLNVVAGLRYDRQSTIADRKALAPRLAMAYALGDTVFRVGAGVFYERLPEAATRRGLLRDGYRGRELVILNPGFPNPLSAGGVNVPPSVFLVPRIRTPRLVQFSLAIEQGLGGSSQLSVEYQGLRGRYLLRSRDINAPLPGTGVRPDADLLNVVQVESTARMRSNSLTVSLRAHVRQRLAMTAQYTLSRTVNDTSGVFSLPADNYSLAAEMGRADFDRQHRFSLAGVVSMFAGLRFGTVLAVASGVPFNITTGRDDNHDTVANDRPRGVTRNTGKGPGLARWDVRLTKLFRVPRPANRDRTARNLELSIDAFNALNHMNPVGFVGVTSSPLFGRPNAARPPRTIQFSVRYRF